GVLVNSVNIGTVASGQWHRRYQTQAPAGLSEEQWLAGMARDRGIPVGRFGRPEEAAAAIVFLCSRQTAFVTGSSLDVGGGVQRYV
ncbi:MAG: SDR family oxidoreductase, partial [Chloroflexota bacterium]